MPSPSSRRGLLALVAATLLVMSLDLAGAPGPGLLRSAGGALFGPLERLVAGATTESGAPSQAAADVVARRTTADLQVAQQRAAASFATLRKAPATRGRPFVPAQVIAVGRLGASGPQRVTLDAGSRDGVRVDLGVVNAQGVVGRVVAVSPWTSDVLLVGSPDLTIAVRAGSAGTVGSIGAGPALGTGGEAGALLELRPVQRGRVAVGDTVTTLGSLGGSPFPAGLRVGTVRQVVTAAAAVVPTASVQPAVDASTLDVVGVLLAEPRTTPRPSATGG